MLTISQREFKVGEVHLRNMDVIGGTSIAHVKDRIVRRATIAEYVVDQMKNNREAFLAKVARSGYPPDTSKVYEVEELRQ